MIDLPARLREQLHGYCPTTQTLGSSEARIALDAGKVAFYRLLDEFV